MVGNAHPLIGLRFWAILLCLTIPLSPTVVAGATERMTSHPALDVFASPSGDGRFLAFVSERSGNADVWLKPLSAGVFSPPRQITAHPGKDTAPSLNRSGSLLVYVSYKQDPRGDIYLLDLLSGKETRLTDSLSGDSWKPGSPSAREPSGPRSPWAPSGLSAHQRSEIFGEEGLDLLHCPRYPF